MKKIYFAVAAMAMLMIAGCEKQNGTIDNASGIDEFNISLKGFTGASGAKTYWDDYGLWWDSVGTDMIIINGKVFEIKKENGTWKAKGLNGGVDAEEGNYYVAYPYSPTSANYNSNTHLYGPITFVDDENPPEKDVIPMAAVSNTNNLTLIPCCAVIKGAYSVEFYSDREGQEAGTCSGEIYTIAYIDMSNAKLVEGTADHNTLTDGDGDGYIIIPLAGESVTAFLNVDGNMTSHAVTLQKGHVYVIGN